MPVDGGGVPVTIPGDPQRPAFGGGTGGMSVWHICQIPAHIPKVR
ncbi:hypothetical protein [Serratia sp. ASV30]|nr:hypothetical protein [Serratia sp. ASV30]